MADSSDTGLPEATAMAAADLLYGVVGGNSRKIQRGNISGGVGLASVRLSFSTATSGAVASGRFRYDSSTFALITKVYADIPSAMQTSLGLWASAGFLQAHSPAGIWVIQTDVSTFGNFYFTGTGSDANGFFFSVSPYGGTIPANTATCVFNISPPPFLSGTLDALIGLDNAGGTGFITQVGANAFTKKTMTAGDGITVANGSGAGGTPTFSLNVNGLTEDTAPDSAADFIPSYDTSASAHKKIKPVNLFSVGGQIKFPATQVPSSNANTLDDYEEGTFTPFFGADGTDGTHSYSQQLGDYIKIARYVWFTLQIVINVKNVSGTMTGNVQIGGLPFSTGFDSVGLGTTASGYFFNWLNIPNWIGSYMGSTRVNLSKATGAASGSTTQVLPADIQSGTGIYLFGCYKAAA